MKDGIFLSVAGKGLVHSLGNMNSLRAVIRGESGQLTIPDLSPLASLLPHRPLRRFPRYAQTALLAALYALDDAGWREDGLLHHTALVIGTAHSGVRMSLDFMDSILDNGVHLASPTAFSHAVNNMGAGLLSLALGMEGPCVTVSQFELSFAGALSAAAMLIEHGRAERVLLGAVDETDTRFTRCCPQLRPDVLPLSEGAVFLCLVPHTPGRAVLRTCWRDTVSREIPLFKSGGIPSDDACCHAPVYGRSPLNQALDTLWALEMIHDRKLPAADCLCFSSRGPKAVIEVRREA